MPVSLLDITPLQENWDASIHALIASLVTGVLRTFAMSISHQGSHTNPSKINIQLQDAYGNNIAEQYFLRIRAASASGYTINTNVTLTPLVGTFADAVVPSIDIILQSDANGLIQIQCTDSTIETFQIILGAPLLAAYFADYNNRISVVHA